MDRNLRKMSALLKKFTMRELEQVLPQTFSTFDWHDVVSRVDELHLGFSVVSCVRVICAFYKEGKSQEKSPDSLIPLLEFRDVFLHPSHDWAGVKLEARGNDGIQNFDSEALRTAIKRGFRSRALSVKVSLLDVDSIKWVMLQEVLLKRKAVTNGPPMFFCWTERLYDVPYIFVTSAKPIPEYTLEILAEVLGFQEYRHTHVSGRNVRQLFTMVMRKCTMSLVPVPEYHPGVPVRKSDKITDYTQYCSRKEYAENVFQNLIESNTLSIESRVSWKGDLNFDSSEKFLVQFKFFTTRKHSVEDFFRKMIEDGVLTVPLPSYIASYATFSKCKLQTRDAKKRRADDLSL